MIDSEEIPEDILKEAERVLAGFKVTVSGEPQVTVFDYQQWRLSIAFALLRERHAKLRADVAPEKHDAPSGDWQRAASGTDYLGFAVERIVWRGRTATIVDRDLPIGTPVTSAMRYTPPPETHVRPQFLSTEDGEFNGNVGELIVPPQCSGSSFVFEPGVLHVKKDGSGYIVVNEEDFILEDDRDAEGGSIHWIARMAASEIAALRDFLNGIPQQHVVGLDELIENARQAASETHSSWEAMCHAILNALGFDFGEPKSFALSGRWLPIEQADKTITNVEDFSEVGIILRTSDRYWVRDEDGRVYEAAWSEGNNGERDYWWDFEGESPADPVEFMPHPLDPRFAATEGSNNG
jgi:hypothetical protein